MIDKEYLCKIFKQCDTPLSEGQAEQFATYAQLLVEWNGRINLTAIVEPEEICEKHFLDSVLPFCLWTKAFKGEETTLIDVGSGAGFPSLPLKIMRPEIRVTMLDGLNKRINFLNEMMSGCGLEGVAIHGRAEEFGRKAEYRERFDIATARAVANLSQLCEYCLPFVRVGGYFAALKGSGGRDELETAKNAIATLGGKLSEVIDYSLPCGDKRTLIVIKKIAATDAKFPRNKGAMTRKPL